MNKENKKLFIAGSNDLKHPEIKFDLKNSKYSLIGESWGEGIVFFYNEPIKFIKENKKEIRPESTFEITMSYFNTSSAVCIKELIETFPKDTQFVWYADLKDSDLLENIEEISEEARVEIKIKPLPIENE